MKRLYRTIALVILLILTSSLPALAVPQQPSAFYGSVTRGGATVPAGTVITAWVDDVATAVGTTTTFFYNADAVYTVSVTVDDPETPLKEGCTAGQTIAFRVDGDLVPQTGTCVSGSNVALALAAPTAGQPALLGVDPAIADPGSTVTVTVNATQTHFVQGVSVADFGAGISIESVSVASPTTLSAQFTVAADAIPGPRTVTVTTDSEVVSLASAFQVRGPGVDFYLPFTGGPSAGHITVPITVPLDLSGLNIIAYEFTLDYDPTVLTPVAVQQVGSLSADWDVIANPTTPGAWRVAAYNETPLSGSGTLLALRFTVGGNVGLTSPLALSDLLLNNGTPTAIGHAGTFAVNALRIAGSVTYGSGAAAVPNAALHLDGAAVLQATSAPDGSFILAAPMAGDYSLTISKTGDVGTAVSAFDAARIAQCVVGLLPFPDCPALSADSDGDGHIRALDAAYVARYTVGLSDSASQVGQWRFAPAAYSFAPLLAEQSRQDFQAYLVGDVTGNWAGSVQGATVASPPVALQLGLPAPHAGGLVVPVRIQGAAGHAVLAVMLDILYPVGDLTFTGLDSADGAAAWQFVYNDTEAGRVRLAGYHTAPLAGDGNLLALRFAAAPGADASMIHISAALLNEGAPPVAILEPTTMLYRQALPLIIH